MIPVESTIDVRAHATRIAAELHRVKAAKARAARRSTAQAVLPLRGGPGYCFPFFEGPA
jgi:hypothetical protein